MIIACLVCAYALVFFVSFQDFFQGLIEKKEVTATAPSSPEEMKEVAADTGPFDETFTITEGDTLASLLNRIGIPSPQAHEAISALSTVFNPKDLKVGQEIYIIYDSHPEGESYDLKFLRLRPDIDYNVEVVRTGGGLFQANRYKKELTREYVHVDGEITLSLYADALKAGASPKMLQHMVNALLYDVDFQRDIHAGAQFSLFYDTYKDEETGLERPGELLYAKLHLNDAPHEIYRFQAPGDIPAYYTAKGEAVKKALLKTPIDGARVNSGFGNRKHPILGYTKMHKGVDFAAPKGTPIMAAGDGVVERCGPYGSYGNYICVRHSGATKTAYAHLSRYAQGVTKGRKVRQGQIIGYVGATGRATGPHLHFELIQNGKHVNPQKVTQCPKTKLGGKALAAFKSLVAKIQKIKKEREEAQRQPRDTYTGV